MDQINLSQDFSLFLREVGKEVGGAVPLPPVPALGLVLEAETESVRSLVL